MRKKIIFSISLFFLIALILLASTGCCIDFGGLVNGDLGKDNGKEIRETELQTEDGEDGEIIEKEDDKDLKQHRY